MTSVQDQLHAKALVMIVGPSAIGKSTLMHAVEEVDTDFGYVKSFTTRAPRPNEESKYAFISRDEALKLHDTSQTITYLEHPTTHDIYGTTVESFPAKYNMLDTLSGTVVNYRNLPFSRTITISLTADPQQWKSWFLSRYPEPSEEAYKRLDEARSSIHWSLHDTHTHWLINQQDSAQACARQLIEIVEGVSEPTTPDHPRAMLELIERGVWQSKK